MPKGWSTRMSRARPQALPTGPTRPRAVAASRETAPVRSNRARTEGVSKSRSAAPSTSRMVASNRPRSSARRWPSASNPVPPGTARPRPKRLPHTARSCSENPRAAGRKRTGSAGRPRPRPGPPGRRCGWPDAPVPGRSAAKGRPARARVRKGIRRARTRPGCGPQWCPRRRGHEVRDAPEAPAARDSGPVRAASMPRCW
jgi:hypothetical protein